MEAHDVVIKSEVTRHTRDNEVFLSFTDDDMADNFLEWWEKEGRDSMMAYHTYRETHGWQ